jgi:predicted nucleic acid-binding protein
MKIFLDAKIFISVLNNEYPNFTYSSRILSLTENRKFAVFTSPICLAIAFYFAEKKSGNIIAKKKIGLLSKHLNISEAVKSDVLNAIENKQINDFEDGLEYYSALRAKCQCIITEDVGDFYFSKIEVLNSRDFLVKYVMG